MSHDRQEQEKKYRLLDHWFITNPYPTIHVNTVFLWPSKFDQKERTSSIWATVHWYLKCHKSFGKINVTLLKSVGVLALFVSVLNAMHVGVLRGEYVCNVPLGDYQFQYLAFKTIVNQRSLFNIISLEEQRETSRVKNNSCLLRTYANYCRQLTHFLVSKEIGAASVVMSEIWKFGFIIRVDKGRITTVKDLESWRCEC